MAKRTLRTPGGRSSEPLFQQGLKGLATISLVAAGSWILYSRLVINHQVVFPDALPAERNTYTGPAGLISYYQSRSEGGRPLVLVHSVNAAASAYEMRPLFLAYRGRRPVFAPDLPGFGFSERSDRVYSPELYQNALLDFLRTQVGEPADVVSLSLGGEFAARAALAEPNLFNSLVLISPTGLSQQKDDRGSQKASRNGMAEVLHPAFAFPVWARPFYDLLSTEKSIRYFLQQSFVGAVPDDLVNYAYSTAHQPGAEHAPLYFISGKLFTPDIRQAVYEQLRVPTLALYDRDHFTSFETLPEVLTVNPVWQAVRLVPTLGMPHFERTEDTVEVLNQFWK